MPAVGAVIQDHCRETIVAAAKVLKNCCSAQEIEAIALLEGAKLAVNWTRSSVIFQSDCHLIIKEINETEASLSPWRISIHDFMSLASLQNDWKCCFAKCSQTCVTHELATYIRKTRVDSVWDSVFTVSVIKALAHDCNNDSVII